MKKLTLGWWAKLALSIIALSGAIKINAQVCSTAVSISNLVPAICTTGVKYTFTYNNPTPQNHYAKIRLGSGANACDSVCMTVPPGAGQLTTSCMPCPVSDTVFVFTYPIPGCTCQGPLPVSFISFTAEENNSGGIKLEWEAEVLNESNAMFKVEKSTDGRNFSVIALVFADQSIRNYSFTDNSAGNTGKVFYRIRFTSNSSTDKLSPVRLVSFEKSTGIKAFVDGSNTLRIEGLTPGEIANAVILDMSGRTMKKSLSYTDQLFSSGIPLPNLAAGIYVVHVTTTSKTYSGKFLKN